MATAVSVRRTRARSPFLLSAPNAENTDWWQEMCTSVGSWLNNNPLLLGISADSIALITSQIKRGNALNCSEDIRRKAWLHIDVEFEGVPGSPMEKFKEMAESAGLKSPAAGDWSPRIQLSKSSRQLSGKLQNVIDQSSAEVILPDESTTREQQQDVADALSALMKSSSVRDNTPKPGLNEAENEVNTEFSIPEKAVQAADDVSEEPTTAENNNRRLSQISCSTTELKQEAAAQSKTNPKKERRASLPAASAVRPGSRSKADATKRRSSVPRSRKSSIGNIVKTSSNIKRRRSGIREKKGNTQTNLLDACRQTLVKSRGDSGSLEKLDTEEEDGETPDLAAEQETAEIPAPLVFNTSEEGDKSKESTENGTKIEFKFRPNSTPQQGKIQLMDPILFNLDSFYRKRDRGTAAKGVTLLMGTLETTHKECVVNVVFDLSKWSEEDASAWLNNNVARLQRPGIE